jgi:hypothetical protein
LEFPGTLSAPEPSVVPSHRASAGESSADCIAWDSYESEHPVVPALLQVMRITADALVGDDEAE